MNRGNTKPKQPQKMDILVERLNKKISRFLGKKDKLPPGSKISNWMFGIIVLSFILILWLATGFYYLGENEFGLIMQNGKVIRVVNGIKVGFVAPYPFGDMEIIDASVSDFIELNKMSQNNGGVNVLSLDLIPLKIDAKFNYQVTDPALVFKTSLQKQNSLDNLVIWNLQAGLHDYLADKSRNDILKANLTLIANEVKNMVNERMSSIGIKVVKLSINSLNEVAAPAVRDWESSVSVTAYMPESVATELLREANDYKLNLSAQTRADVTKFNQLLPKYKSNPKEVTQQMYDDTLQAIPTASLSDQYPLLQLNLSELIMLSQTRQHNIQEITASEPLNLRERHFGREVKRDRSAVVNEDSSND